MKIVSDDSTYIIPMCSNKIVINTINYKRNLIDCLNSYFVSKKKSLCLIYDECGNLMHTDDTVFIYISDEISLDNNLALKTKTITNNIIAEIVNSNPEMFTSFYHIRNELINANSDQGFIKLTNVINKGLNRRTNIICNEFNIGLLLQMFSIEDLELSNSEKMIIIMNLMISLSKTNNVIVYLDCEIDKLMNEWINSNSNNVFFLIDNDSVNEPLDYYDLLLLSNCNHLSEASETMNNIRVISYMNHNLIKSNLSLQNEKNIELYKRYYATDSSFFIKNNPYNTL